MPRRTFLCRMIFCAVFSVCIVNVFTGASAPSFFLRYSKPVALAQEDIFCPHSELADDVLVILRTGATESHQKVPVHFKTTLRCVPHFVVYSDYDEEIDGHPVHDVLSGVSDDVKDHHDDFKLYHRLQKHGKSGVHQNVITSQSGSSKGDYLNTNNDGWKLDKWKFLPMIDEAYHKMPSAKWYVFIESDTYLVWNNLLEYLSNFDADKPYYIGKHLYISDVEFGYGGAGFVLSNPAMRKVSEHRSLKVRDYEDFTASHWVGDCALGKVLEDVKVPLHRAFPHMQGDSPATMDPKTIKMDRDAWCYPAITYHHVSPPEIEELWRFEQDWFKRHDILLRHRDVFMEHVRPQVAPSKEHWDNMSADKEYSQHEHSNLLDPLERVAWQSFDKCRAVCESKSRCLQFSFQGRICAISYAFRLGYSKPTQNIQSGWMTDRVDEHFQSLESKCSFRDWFAPQDTKDKQENSDLRRRRRR